MKTNGNHTQGPWIVVDQSPLPGVSFGDLKLKSLAIQRQQGNETITSIIGEMILPDDAERIVVCVNLSTKHNHNALQRDGTKGNT